MRFKAMRLTVYRPKEAVCKIGAGCDGKEGRNFDLQKHLGDFTKRNCRVGYIVLLPLTYHHKTIGQW